MVKFSFTSLVATLAVTATTAAQVLPTAPATKPIKTGRESKNNKLADNIMVVKKSKNNTLMDNIKVVRF
jgi:hypothetical protein